MEKKIAWLVVSCLMALSLVMAACAPAAVEEEEKEVVVEEEVEEEVVEEVVTPTVEKPEYGGVLKVLWPRDLIDFDQVVGKITGGGVAFVTTNELLWNGDWARGPAGGYGTNEAAWTDYSNVWSLTAGFLAESWELPTKIEGETASFVVHIRQGVHWALNPDSEASRLVGGREMTVDDVIFSLKNVFTDKRSYKYKERPSLRDAKITSPAPWTVKFEVPWDAYNFAVDEFMGQIWIVPPEVVQKLGDMNNWKLSVGTGPFMLTNVVPSSTVTLVRNPNYWMKDPVGPGKGNQLPYLDGLKFFVITDKSTGFAALRTAKVDWAGERLFALRDDVLQLKKNTPQLITKQALVPSESAQHSIAMKLGKPPFNDIRVRRAMMMAIDFEGIKRDFFGGEAEILTWPQTYNRDYADACLLLDDPEMPASVKELYSYNPEKAKALLTEAGYPQGFKAELIILSRSDTIDYWSIIEDMWSKVGIDVTLVPKETGAFDTLQRTHEWPEMMAVYPSNHTMTSIYGMPTTYGPGIENQDELNDPVINEYHAKIQPLSITDQAEANRLNKELLKYLLDQAYAIPKVKAPVYALWWPWMKNYSGESYVGKELGFFQYVWIDQELKKSMGY